MMESKRGWLLAALTAVFLAVTVLWPVRILTLESRNGEPHLLTVGAGDTITLQYVHSIYRVIQREIYQPVGNELVLRAVYFGDMSAALYYDGYARYPLEPEPGGSYSIKGLNQHYPAISFALGHGTQYEILIGTTQVIDLDKAFKDATFLTVKTEVLSRGEYILRRLRNGNR